MHHNQSTLKEGQKEREKKKRHCDDDIKSLKLNQHIDKISKTFE